MGLEGTLGLAARGWLEAAEERTAGTRGYPKGAWPSSRNSSTFYNMNQCAKKSGPPAHHHHVCAQEWWCSPY